MRQGKEGRNSRRVAAGQKDVRLLKALSLLHGADSVEFKLMVPESDRASAAKALEIDILDAELRQVVFFDTPDLDLNHAGIVLRARRIRKGGDTVVKLRPLIPETVPEKLRRSGSFNIEVDVMPGSLVCSGSLKGKAANSAIKDVISGKRRIKRLFLPEQCALYKKHAPKGLDVDSLLPFGPINIAKLKSLPNALKGQAIVAEMWFYPDGSRILELSTKCVPDRALQVLNETREFLLQRGLRVTGEQETKTRKALAYFANLAIKAPRAA
jgi:hypothetical protein